MERLSRVRGGDGLRGWDPATRFFGSAPWNGMGGCWEWGRGWGWGWGSRRDVMAGGTGGSRTAPTRWLSEGMRDGSPHSRGHGRGWILACVFTGVGSARGGRGRGWVPAPRLHGGEISTRGQREGVNSCLRLHGGGLCAGMTEGMGPRIREDNGRGWVPGPRIFTGAMISTRGQREGVESWLRFHGGGTSAGMTEGMA